jgi:dolichyldiphosphatase
MQCIPFPIGVTIPAKLDFLSALAVGFSIMPIPLISLTAILMIITRRLSMILVFISGMVTIGLVELLRLFFSDPMPITSCFAGKNGMPSTFSALAVTSYIWFMIVLSAQHWRTIETHVKWRVTAAIGITIMFLPIAPSRVFVGDHTWLQVGVGCGIGLVCALLYIPIVIAVSRKLQKTTLPQWLRCTFINNDCWDTDDMRVGGKDTNRAVVELTQA